MLQKETDKHRQIMTAAARLFATQGYQKTTIDEIVSEANISKGLFYHYFKNKKELYLYLYDSYVRVLSQSIREKVDTDETDFFNRMKQISLLRIDFVIAYPSLMNFLYSAYYEEHPDVLPFIKDKNLKLLEESYSSSASNIDWSKLKQGMSPERAIELVAWVAEGFVKKIAETKTLEATDAYYEFDQYLDYLKTGLYENKGE